MDNKDIIKVLKTTASLMELHEENPFKIKSYNNAIFNLERYDEPLKGLDTAQLGKIQGVGKSIAQGIGEILDTGTLEDLQSLIEKTPEGVMEMLNIKGIGAKKIRLVWKELRIEDTGALLEATKSGTLAKVKGFGEKTQENIKQVLLFQQANQGKLHYRKAEEIGKALETSLTKAFPDNKIMVTGEIRRKMEVINRIDLLVATENKSKITDFLNSHTGLKYLPKNAGPFTWRGEWEATNTPVKVRFCNNESFVKTLMLSTGSPTHLSTTVNEDGQNLLQIAKENPLKSEEEAYQLINMPYIAPEIREGQFEWKLAKGNNLPKLIEMQDLKGILHNHSTYSDGKHSLEEMAKYCMELGYEYLGISDHSQSAFYYANGLKEERVIEQHLEIDKLNHQLNPFKIFKGIESDILPDGRLDYDDEVLASFDFIVASIHSGLSMDKKKATKRLLTAIANPFTTMLGHPTGRLLLQRKGYPVDHKTIIDACAEHGVVIEINSHPYRLDLDWRWIHYAIEKGVMLSLNPDAHEKDGYKDMYYGLCVGRKGGLTKEMNFNSLSLEEVEKHFLQRKQKALASS